MINKTTIIIATSAPKKFKLGAAIIKWWQKTDFSHVLIIKDDIVYQASHGYVNATHIDVFLEENIIFNSYTVDESTVDFEFIKRQLGKHYGYKQLINIASRYLFGIRLFKRDGNSRFICSEFVGKALKLDWITDETTPLEIDTYLRTKNGCC